MKIFTGQLWRHREFIKLWSGESISAFGSAITGLALPLVAVITLEVGAREMGILRALEHLPVLLFGLLMGVWVDRVRRRPLMVVSQFGQAILLAFIPAAAFLGILRIEILYVVAFFVGILSHIYTLAATSFLPSIVERVHLVEGNSSLGVSRSTASVAGPGFAGFLIESLTAPFAIVLDALSFVISGMCLLFIRSSERIVPHTRGFQGIWRDVGEGVRLVIRHPILFYMTFGTAISSFGGSIQGAVSALYLVRELMITPAWLGVIGSIAGVAALLGSVAAVPLARRIGPGPVLIVTTLFWSFGILLIPIAGSVQVFVMPLVIVGHVFSSAGLAIFSINQVSLRQAVTPDRLLGRVNASRRVLVFGVIPIGSMLGGLLGEMVGWEFTLVTGAGVGILAFFFFLCSPIRKVVDFEDGKFLASSGLSV